MSAHTRTKYVGMPGRSEWLAVPNDTGSYIVEAGDGNDFVWGFGSADFLYGQAGRDHIDGDPGDDVIFGDFTHDDSLLGSSAGGDADYLHGDSGHDVIFASVGNDFARGGSGNDAVHGGTGEDILWGGYGADVVTGGSGNDTLCGHGAAEGSVPDAYKLTVAYTHDGRDDADIADGTVPYNYLGFAEERDDTGADTLDGGDGNDLLSGGFGADQMAGGNGNDTFLVSDAGDTVVETVGGGSDIVFAEVSFVLAGNAEVEALQAFEATATTTLNLTGSATNNAITGNAGTNLLTGLAGNESLSGLAGNDRLIGGAGNDRLTGGAGKDAFVFNASPRSENADRIVDFRVADDTILLENAVLRKVGSPGRLKADAFVVGAKAQDAEDRIIYDRGTGWLSYDADGSGAAKAVLLAQLSKGLKMTYADFLVI
jgi:Ca2+-binding RTX toxin-like protein